MTVNCTSLALNLRWVAWVILLHLRFLFIRLPSSRRCGLAETVGLCFRVDSDRVTLGFVLGLVCVCVFVLFCSVVVVLFVVGRQQHCRYIVIDAMVYPKNWILEDKFSTGKTSGVFGLNLVFLHLVFATEKILNLEVTTLCMNRPRWVLDDALSSTLWLWKTCSSLATIFWSWMWSGTWTFFCGSSNTIGIRTWQWCEWMRCHVERGYGNLTPCGSTLWVRVKRHAIHHGCIVLYTEDTWKATTRVHRVMCTRKIGREHSTYCGRNLVCDQPVSQYSISLRTHHSSDILRCHWSVLTWMWCIDQFYILFWILLESGTAYCLSWRYLHWLDIEIVYCVFDTEKFILSKWWEHTARNSWRRV